MQSVSIAAIEFIGSSKKAVTTKQFLTHFEPYGQAVLDTILNSHVDEVKGKLVLNEAGKEIYTNNKSATSVEK